MKNVNMCISSDGKTKVSVNKFVSIESIDEFVVKNGKGSIVISWKI